MAMVGRAAVLPAGSAPALVSKSVRAVLPTHQIAKVCPPVLGSSPAVHLVNAE